MVTKIGTAKHTVRSIEKLGDWLFKCEADGIASKQCAEAAGSCAKALSSIKKWLEDQA